MASTIEAKYGTNNQSITCTLTSLGAGVSRGSLAVDNTTNVFLDALVFVKIKTGASGVSSNGQFTIYAYGTADGGTTYSDGVAGTDSNVTLTNPPNVRVIGILNAVNTSTTYAGGPYSAASAFNGILPDHWGIIVTNNSSGTTDATVASAWYQGVLAQTT